MKKEGTLFKSLSADYFVKNKYKKGTKDDSHTEFSCVYHLNAVYDAVHGYYTYTIGRSDILIDDRPVKKLMDKIICEIGDSIYPVSLAVTPWMQIRDVVNYEEIRQRWTDCTKELLRKYPSYPMRRYVKMSERNISDKEKLISSLYKDTFFNVYFRDIYTPTEENEAMSILWENFPKREMNQTYQYQVSPMQVGRISTSGEVMQIVPGQEGNYSMDYTLGEEVEILDITGNIESKYQDKLYAKQISVKSQNIKTGGYSAGNIII